MNVKISTDLVVVRLCGYLGMSARRLRGSDEKMYLSFVVWYPRAWRRLGYIYGSCRWFEPRSTTQRVTLPGNRASRDWDNINTGT